MGAYTSRSLHRAWVTLKHDGTTAQLVEGTPAGQQRSSVSVELNLLSVRKKYVRAQLTVSTTSLQVTHLCHRVDWATYSAVVCAIRF